MCTIVLIIPAGKEGLTSVICENSVGHILTSFAEVVLLLLSGGNFWFYFCKMSFESNENKFSLYLHLYFFNAPCVCFMLPQDGSRGRSGWKKRRLQPALWHLGCGHYCNRTGWTTAPYVWPAPHEVEGSAILEMKMFFAIYGQLKALKW